jgi:uncharacterized protein (TIGR02147 family)
MRAFARDLGIPISTLSEVFNGKKGISPNRSRRLIEALRLPDWQAQFFCDLVTKEHAKSPRARQEAKNRLKGREQENQVHVINQTALRSLTSWIDLAILELTYLKEFKPSSRWIARQLQVDESLVSQSIERLKIANLLKIDTATSTWLDASPLFSTTDGIPNESIRRFHRSVLHLALKKLESANVEDRTVKTAVFSVAKDRIPKAKKILDEAIAKIVALADESSQEREDVMCFSAQLFSVLDSKGKI